MTDKPRERLHVIHLRCQHCNHHYNTCNLGMVVTITTLYLNDPLEHRTIQHWSPELRSPLGLTQVPTVFERLRRLNTPRYSYYTQQLQLLNERENGMETLELDTPSDMVSIPESMPPLEDLSLNS